MINIFKPPVVPVSQPAVTTVEYELQWRRWSAERWRAYFGNFIADIDVSDEPEARVADLIRRSAMAADQALEKEQERWGRTAMNEGAK